MAEDDRAAKAARAKALLKKRQQKKTGAPTSNPGAITPSPSSPTSRAMSPAPAQHEVLNDGINEFGELESRQAMSLASDEPVNQRVSLVNESRLSETLSAAYLFPSEDVETTTSPAPPKGAEDVLALVQNQKQTISLLVSEKTSLSESLEKLEGIDTKLKTTEHRLEEETRKAHELRAQLGRLEDENNLSKTRHQELGSENIHLRDKLTELERELHLTSANANDLRAQVEKRDRRTRELEEQIQNDDRVERLEKLLQNTQSRADELEFQLSKLGQAHTKLKGEREKIETDLRLRSQHESEWEQKHAMLEQNHTSSQQQLSTLTSERGSLLTAKSNLESELESSRRTLAELQQKATQAASDLAVSSRQLENAQGELRTAARRADDAEKTQRELQNEGTTLMHSLEEMRAKTVELTGEKLNLTEKVDGLNRELRQRDYTIAQLEGQVELLQQSTATTARNYQEMESGREQDKITAEESMAEIQGAYVELQGQLDDAVASVRELDSERSHSRQNAIRQQEEIDRLLASQEARSEEVATLQEHLEERSKAREDEQRLLREVQTEIETLRAGLLTKDDEIARLRDAVSLTASISSAPQSLDEEMMSALKQQHALDLSTAQSRIRNLETLIYDAEAKAHTFQKQVGLLEEELSQLRSLSRSQRPFSPAGSSNHGSRGFKRPDDQRRLSFASQRSTSMSAPPPSQLNIDQSLPPAIRHQRRVSLGMLKARMDSEVEAASFYKPSRPPSRVVSPPALTRKSSSKAGLPTVHEPSDNDSIDGSHAFVRPQFLDESHVFWCASCKGDLIVL